MKNFVLICLLVCSTNICLSQYEGILPYETQLNYLKVFYKGYFRQLEFQKVQSYKSGDKILGYVDTKGALKVYANGQTHLLAPIQNGYVVSDNYLVTNVGTIISAWSDEFGGKKLANFGGSYVATDSMVIFENTQQRSINVYYNDQIITLSTGIELPEFPKNYGDNVLIYNNMGTSFVFYRGQTYELGTYQKTFLYDCGRDIAAFNDPMTFTFAIFEDGQFLDLDNFHAKSFKCGIQSVTYIDNSGNLQYYSHGEKTTLSNYSPDYWDAKDYMVAWGENTYFYVWDGTTKIQAATYKPEKWIIKNNVVAFQNQMGGVSCVINGKVVPIYTGKVVDFMVRGSSIIIQLPNYIYLVYYKGKKYTS